MSRSWRDWALTLILTVSGPLVGADNVRPSDAAPLRIAFSSRMFVDVNENDAKASVKVWAQTLGRERGIPVESETRILAGPSAIALALRDHLIDAITMPTDEYWTVRNELPLGPFILGIKNGKTTDEYVLLVHRDSDIAQLGDLRGRSLVIFQNPRASVAPQWLETLLLQAGLGRAAEFWGRVTNTTKPARVVLPVFFRQADACLLTRDGFQTMTELNPQVGQQMKVLATSVAMVPVVFCFRGDFNSPWRDKLLASIDRIHETSAGQQTLTLFQSERLIEKPVSSLHSACELLDLHRRLWAEAEHAPAVNVLRAPPEPTSRNPGP